MDVLTATEADILTTEYWDQRVAHARCLVMATEDLLAAYRQAGYASVLVKLPMVERWLADDRNRLKATILQRDKVQEMARGGCGLPGHVTECADEPPIDHGATQQHIESVEVTREELDARDTESMRLEELDAAPARQEVYNGD